MEKNWSIQTPWNNSLIIPSKRENQARDMLWASEIGRDYYEVYLSMNGIEPTNKFSDTIRRKFEAGNFYEAIVIWTCQKVGILKNTQGQVRLFPEDKSLLPIYGRYDILAGHNGDWQKTKKEMEDYFNKLIELEFDFPFFDRVKKIAFETINYLSEKYPQGLTDKIYEVKSLNSLAFWRGGEPISTPYEHHIFQQTFYQLYNKDNTDIGSFLYIDRDTMSLSELPNLVKPEVVEKMKEWHKQISYYYLNKVEPKPPELIIFSEKEQKYQVNWQFERSAYKDRILGDKKLEDITEEVKQKNQILKEQGLMKSAKNGESRFGTKKYEKAIKLIQAGLSLEEIEAKTGVALHALHYYQEQL